MVPIFWHSFVHFSSQQSMLSSGEADARADIRKPLDVAPPSILWTKGLAVSSPRCHLHSTWRHQGQTLRPPAGKADSLPWRGSWCTNTFTTACSSTLITLLQRANNLNWRQLGWFYGQLRILLILLKVLKIGFMEMMLWCLWLYDVHAALSVWQDEAEVNKIQIKIQLKRTTKKSMPKSFHWWEAFLSSFSSQWETVAAILCTLTWTYFWVNMHWIVL